MYTINQGKEVLLSSVQAIETGIQLTFKAVNDDDTFQMSFCDEWKDDKQDPSIRDACRLMGVDVYAVENVLFRDVIDHTFEITLDNGSKEYETASNLALIQRIKGREFLQASIGKSFTLQDGRLSQNFTDKEISTKILTLADVQIHGWNPIDYLQMSFINPETGFTAFYIFTDTWLNNPDCDCLGIKETLEQAGLNVQMIEANFITKETHPEILEVSRFNAGLAALKTKEGCQFKAKVFNNHVVTFEPIQE